MTSSDKTNQHFNLGSERRPFVVEFAMNPIFDLLVALWSTDEADPKIGTNTIDDDWFEEFNAGIPVDTAAELGALGIPSMHKTAWMLLTLIATRLTEVETPEEVFDWLTHNGWDSLLSEFAWRFDDAAIAAVTSGDPAERQRLISHLEESWAAHGVECDEPTLSVETFLDTSPHDYNVRLVNALKSVHDTAFRQYKPDWMTALQRSVESVGLTVPGTRPETLIERITNGIDFEIPLGTTRMILIPSVLVRPWSVVTDVGSTVLVVYPVSDECINADPDAPPSWLVSFYKALGDAKRMKILKRLATGPADLGELTELLGMAKSSTFHHIGVLRSAGLIRVHVGGTDDRTYTLRTRAFPDADGLLDKYLDTPLFAEGDIS